MSGVLGDPGKADWGGGAVQALEKLVVCSVGSIGGGILVMCILGVWDSFPLSSGVFAAFSLSFCTIICACTSGESDLLLADIYVGSSECSKPVNLLGVLGSGVGSVLETGGLLVGRFKNSSSS
jgi:hypothetical protein